VVEGIDLKIMTIKSNASRYRNIEHCKTAELFYCGGLKLDQK
jgi:hypothetical protein